MHRYLAIYSVNHTTRRGDEYSREEIADRDPNALIKFRAESDLEARRMARGEVKRKISGRYYKPEVRLKQILRINKLEDLE